MLPPAPDFHKIRVAGSGSDRHGLPVDPIDTPGQALDYRRVARVLRYLDTHYRSQPTLAELSAHAGLSEGHLQRLFVRHVGISPKRFLQQRTARHARALLRAEASVLSAAAAVGLSGGGRLHDLMLATEALTPGEVKRTAGLPLRYGLVPTPLGDLLAAAGPRGVCAVHFLDAGASDVALLQHHFRGAVLVRDDSVARHVAGHIFDAGGLSSGRPLSLWLRGTAFQLQVWCALLSLPSGECIAYGELARGLGRPTGARAVAGAVAHNPIAALVPCHRVVRETGALGGYRWGLERKQVLLAREAAVHGTAGD